jgi:hypothetical protein
LPPLRHYVTVFLSHQAENFQLDLDPVTSELEDHNRRTADGTGQLATVVSSEVSSLILNDRHVVNWFGTPTLVVLWLTRWTLDLEDICDRHLVMFNTIKNSSLIGCTLVL